MIIANLTQIRENIKNARQRRANKIEAAAVKLIAVTKNHDIMAMRAAIDAGVLAIGENRVQEAAQKAESLARTVEWHLIGHLQRNKVKTAVQLFDLIHSVDSEKLLLEINRIAGGVAKVQDILIQVNLAKETSKFGIYREDLNDFIQLATGLKNVRLCGLMAIAPHYEVVEDTRMLFREMFTLFTDLKAKNLPQTNIKYLSMGMSNDYEIAIEEGANLIRVGTSIFGQRQYE